MNIFNKKIILFFSIFTLMINGCVAKNEFKTQSATRVLLSSVTPLKTKVTRGKVRPIKIKNIKKEDCIDCYATPMNYSKSSLVTRTFTKAINTKRYGSYDYTEKASDTTLNDNQYFVPAVSTIKSSYRSYSSYSKISDTAIQVGAFNKYSGAKIYKKRYDALSNKYKVSIKTSTKKNKPLYRVRIEGFKNKVEAKKFMDNYAIRDAFLVRK